MRSKVIIWGVLPGDQAGHLMWRLLHGQLYVQHQPQVLVVMIGTNDLGAASCRGGEPGITQAAAGAAQRSVSRWLPNNCFFLPSCQQFKEMSGLYQHVKSLYGAVRAYACLCTCSDH